MPFEANVFNVMIASPSDVQVERNIVREVIHDWNAINSATRGIVLLPLGWETHSTPLMGDRPQAIINSQVLNHSDLLVAIFWTRLGSPTGKAVSGTVEELDEHLQSGKPALTYFSSAPVVLDSVDSEQYQRLREFKDICKDRGLIQEFSSSSDFSDKFRRHLSTTINSHPYFAEYATQTSATLEPTRASPIPPLSKEAIDLLLNATSDRNGQIIGFRTNMGLSVQTNGKSFVERRDARSEALWQGALDELESNDLIIAASYKREVFRVTRRGFEVADLLRPSP